MAEKLLHRRLRAAEVRFLVAVVQLQRLLVLPRGNQLCAEAVRFQRGGNGGNGGRRGTGGGNAGVEVNVAIVDGNGGEKRVLALKGAENRVGLGLEGRILDEEARVNQQLAVSNRSAHFDGKMRGIGNGALEKRGCTINVG